MISSSEDWVGAGDNRVFHPDNASISVSGDASDLWVRVHGGNLDDSFGLNFSAPSGESLMVGMYERANDDHLRQPGRPGISIGGDGRGCNTASGRFEVKEIGATEDPVTGEGEITNLWIVYEQHCGGGNTGVLIGEVRYNVAGDGGSAVIGPRYLRWPDADPNQAMPVASVWVTNPASAPLAMTQSRISGDSDFAIREDGCVGRTLVQDTMCEILVRFAPGAPGPKVATLQVAEATGAEHPVSLSANVRDSTTRFLMYSERGDWVGDGHDYSYDPSNASIWVKGSRSGIHGGIDSAGDWWYFNFTPPDGDALVAGSTYTEARRYPFNSPAAGIDVTGNGRGCNEQAGEFTISQLSFDPYGELERVGLYFEQHCGGEPSALYGILDFRAKPPTSPPDRSLSVSTAPDGAGRVVSTPPGIDCGSDCHETYTFGREVKLEPQPSAGSEFEGWTGSCSGQEACFVKMGRDHSVGATFRKASGKLGSTSSIFMRDKTRRRVFLKGWVRPRHAGAHVVVSLWRNAKGSYRLVSRKRPTLSDASTFRTRFDRPRSGRCRAVVRFPGDSDHQTSKDAITFLC